MLAITLTKPTKRATDLLIFKCPDRSGAAPEQTRRGRHFVDEVPRTRKRVAEVPRVADAARRAHTAIARSHIRLQGGEEKSVGGTTVGNTNCACSRVEASAPASRHEPGVTATSKTAAAALHRFPVRCRRCRRLRRLPWIHPTGSISFLSSTRRRQHRAR